MSYDYTWNIVIDIIIFVAFFFTAYTCCYREESKLYTIFLSLAFGATFAFIYLNSFELPSKVTEKDRAIIHFLYLLNLIIISLFVIYCVWIC